MIRLALLAGLALTGFGVWLYRITRVEYATVWENRHTVHPYAAAGVTVAVIGAALALVSALIGLRPVTQ